MSARDINWRCELLLASILAMDATWLAPWAAVLTGTAGDPKRGLAPLGLFVLLAGALYGARLLGAWRLPLGAQQALAGMLAVATGWLLIGLCLYPEHPFLGQAWMLAWLGDLATLQGYGMGGLVLLGVALYAWGRGIGLAQNSLATETVGLYLRWGIIAWFWFHLYGLVAGADVPVGWLFSCFFFGLLAVGLSRVEEVQRGRGTVRSPFTASWVATMAGVVLGAVGLGFAATLALSQALVARLWSALGPLGIVLSWVLHRLVELLFLLATPLLNWLSRAMGPVAEQVLSSQRPGVVPELGPVPERTGVPVPILALVWVLLGLAFLSIVVLVVTVMRRRQEQAEAWAGRETTWERAEGTAGSGLGAGLQRLRERLASALEALRPPSYGLASVREMYASLQRLAAWRGLPREAAETPYEFERRLDGTWPQAEQAVASLTGAYVQAHYGERAFSAEEIEALRAHWQRLRELVEGNGEG